MGIVSESRRYQIMLDQCRRARVALHRAAELRRPHTQWDRYGSWSPPPPFHVLLAWDQLYAWKLEWVNYGDALIHEFEAAQHRAGQGLSE